MVDKNALLCDSVSFKSALFHGQYKSFDARYAFLGIISTIHSVMFLFLIHYLMFIHNYGEKEETLLFLKAKLKTVRMVEKVS